MANIGKPVDDFLLFVQQSFNTDDESFIDALRKLEYTNNLKVSDLYNGKVSNSAISTNITGMRLSDASDSKQKLKELKSYSIKKSELARMEREVSRIKAQAAKLAGNKPKILFGLELYKNFEKLGNFGLDSKGLRETYKVSNDIIKDINVARNWLNSYKKFKNQLNKLSNNRSKLTGSLQEDLHEELLVLGQSILGRAIELCPMDTGRLRQSGTLFDFGNYIVIAFTAPYASYVHENMEIKHPWHMYGRGWQYDCGGQAKFLEKALQQFFPDRTVWTEHTGFGGVMVKISLNPLLIEYKHYE
jgi:hypothetical protein